MILGFHTAALHYHSPEDAIELLSEIGYTSVALMLRAGALGFGEHGLADQLDRVRARLEGCGMRSVVETSGPFQLDSRDANGPSLLSPSADARARRLASLFHAVDVAGSLGSSCVSMWSGAADDPGSDEERLERLSGEIRRLLDYADRRRVAVAIEPQPAMFIDTTARFERLLEWVDAPHLKLTLDVCNLLSQGEIPIGDYIRRNQGRIANVHLADLRPGDPTHRLFGEGQIRFPPIIAALAEVGYSGGVHVELNSQYSLTGPSAAQQAYSFLDSLTSGTE